MADNKTSDSTLTEALELFEESQTASDFNRTAWHDDINFARLAEQWPDKVQKQRESEGRPCLTINKLPAFVRQVVNDARQNKPGIMVHPVDNGADEDTAEVLNGLIRSIERNSNADVAYSTALDQSVSGGFGFFTIGIDYANNHNFDMECQIRRVPNALAVHWDINTTEFDASDWMYCFVSRHFTEEEFARQWPDAEKVDFQADHRDNTAHWLDDSGIRVSEYWRREEIDKKILQLSTGDVIRAESLEGEEGEVAKALMEIQGIKVARERKLKGYRVVRRVISGVEILEEQEWPGELIPVCPVWGEEIILDGRRFLRSMIRDAKDPQLMFNFWRSATTELVALAPRAPYIGPKGFVPKGQEEVWQSANTRSHAYMEYEGQVPPQRQPFAGVPAGALQEALNASDDMKSITGIHDAGLGARSNETSGRAIMARQRESDVSNYHFIDNLSRAIRYAGKVLVEIIPHVYRQREALRILGPDMKEKLVNLQGAEGGEGKLYDLTAGKYDVSIRSGSSYTTQREETRETLIEIMRNVPDAARFIGDVMLEHMDFQGADRVAKRMKLLLPPEIQKAESAEEEGQEKIPAAALQKIGQLEQQLQQGGQAMQKMQEEMGKMKQQADSAQADAARVQVENQKLQLDRQELQAKMNKMAADIARDKEKLAIEWEKLGDDRAKTILNEVNRNGL